MDDIQIVEKEHASVVFQKVQPKAQIDLGQGLCKL